MATPSITTIRQPLSEMAEAAVSIIDAIQNNRPYESEHIFPVELIRRETL
jgi:LacI family sucrose operon transcriptional repressor